MKKVSGFTLIELLVVIAIIGILASVVLASLNTARDKGADASVTQSINNMRAEAELFYDDNLSYSAMCDSTIIQTALTKADDINNAGSVICVDGDDVTGQWAIEVQLISSTTRYYCVDSTGNSDVTTGSTISIASTDAECN